jgi:hypothetical protein
MRLSTENRGAYTEKGRKTKRAAARFEDDASERHARAQDENQLPKKKKYGIKEEPSHPRIMPRVVI